MCVGVSCVYYWPPRATTPVSSLQSATGVRTPYGRAGGTPPCRYGPHHRHLSRIVDIHNKMILKYLTLRSAK